MVDIFKGVQPNLNELERYYDATFRGTRGTVINGIAGQDIIIWGVHISRGSAGGIAIYDGAGAELLEFTIQAGTTFNMMFYPLGIRLTTGNDVEAFMAGGGGIEKGGIFYSYVDPI